MKRISYTKILSFVLGAGLLSGCATTRNNNFARYIVKTRVNRTIVIKDVAGISPYHIVVFNDKEMAYYNNIHVGDTIGFARPFPDSQRIIWARDADIRMISRGDIMRAYELQQQTILRDSLVNKKNIKHK